LGAEKGEWSFLWSQKIEYFGLLSQQFAWIDI
jgi:hypothetical protein